MFNGDFAIKMFVNSNEIRMIGQRCSNLEVFDGVFTESPNFKIKEILLKFNLPFWALRNPGLKLYSANTIKKVEIRLSKFPL